MLGFIGMPTWTELAVLLFAALLCGLPFALLGSWIGSHKDASLAGFLLGLLPDRRPQCPCCRGRLPDRTARICLHCHRDPFGGTPRAASSSVADSMRRAEEGPPLR